MSPCAHTRSKMRTDRKREPQRFHGYTGQREGRTSRGGGQKGDGRGDDCPSCNQ